MLLFAVLALTGGALLAAAEFSTTYEVVVGTLDIVRTKKSGSDQHSYALLILAAATLPLALGALRGARKPVGPLPESQDFEDARARPADGLSLEIAGGGLLVLAGAGLLVVRRARDVAPAPSEARRRAAASAG